MANVLSDEKKQQVVALGRLGWALRRIERATGVRRETAAGYLKAAGIPVRPPGWERRAGSKPAIEVITDFGAGNPACGISSDPALPKPHRPPPSELDTAKPATEVTTDSALPPPPAEAPALLGRPPIAGAMIPGPGAEPAPGPVPTVSASSSPSASACEPYHELIEQGLARGRNAMAIWQDLVSENGFTSGDQSVRRFVGKLRGGQVPQAHPVIVTAEEAQVDYGTGPMVPDPQSGKYRRMHPSVRADSGLQPQVGPPARFPIQLAHLGGTARESLSPFGRCG